MKAEELYNQTSAYYTDSYKERVCITLTSIKDAVEKGHPFVLCPDMFNIREMTNEQLTRLGIDPEPQSVRAHSDADCFYIATGILIYPGMVSFDFGKDLTQEKLEEHFYEALKWNASRGVWSFYIAPGSVFGGLIVEPNTSPPRMTEFYDRLTADGFTIDPFLDFSLDARGLPYKEVLYPNERTVKLFGFHFNILGRPVYRYAREYHGWVITAPK